MRLPATARCGTFACLLGEGDAESPLEKTLREEKAADQKLNQLSDAINPEAASGEVQEEQTESVRRGQSAGDCITRRDERTGISREY
jgi:hypothetical protein